MKNKVQSILLLGSAALSLALQIKRYQEEKEKNQDPVEPAENEVDILRSELQNMKEELARSQDQIESLKSQLRSTPVQTPIRQTWPDSWTCNSSKTIRDKGTTIDSVPLTKEEILSQISTVAHSGEEALKKGITIAANSISELLDSLNKTQGE